MLQLNSKLKINIVLTNVFFRGLLGVDPPKNIEIKIDPKLPESLIKKLSAIGHIPLREAADLDLPLCQK